MIDADYEPAIDFLTQFFANTTHNVEIRSLPQEHGAGPNRPRFSRDSDIIIDHCRKWDQVGRAVYFGCCTRITGRPTGSRADCAELPALWVDIDCAKQSFSKEDACHAALSLPIRPSLLVDSGGGIHCYWLLREAISVRADADGADNTEQEVVAVLRQLAGVLAGDPAVCDLARVMRLPGTHNSKYDLVDGEGVITGKTLMPVFLLPVSDFSLRYEFGDIVKAFDVKPPAPRARAEAVSSGPIPEAYVRKAVEGELGRVLSAAEGSRNNTLNRAAFALGQFVGAHALNRGDARTKLAAAARAVGLPDAEASATIASGLGDGEQEPRGVPVSEYATQQLRSESSEKIDSNVVRLPRAELGEKSVVDIVQDFNRRYFVVNEEGRVLVYEPSVDETIGRRCYRRLTFEDLKRFWLNCSKVIGQDKRGKDIVRTYADIWLSHPERKTFNDIVFDPRGGSLPPSTLNLWQGFAVAPATGSWALLREHILEVICLGNEEHYGFLMGWMARLIQRPELQGEVAVVLKGPQGAGKGTLARALMHVLGQHSMTVSTAKHLIGSFNGHLRDLVFLFADEAFWAGDKQHVGVLKSLITEPYLTIEAKYQAPVQMRNFIHLMMASNEDWVVPASLDSRRFFVLEIGEDHLNDHAYFAALIAELESGGYGAMLADLLAYDLSGYNPRAIPQTEGLNDQRILSLSVIEEWWLTVLQREYVWKSRLGLEDDFGDWWSQVSTELLYASYVDFSGSRRERRPVNIVHFGRFMRRMECQPTHPKTGVMIGEHVVDNPLGGRAAKVLMGYDKRCYALGELEDARAAFERVTKLTIDWGESDAEEV